MKRKGKLVRDKIPQLIGKGTVKVRKLTNREFRYELARKLVEEAGEFARDGSLEELADVLEVIHAILEFQGVDFFLLERLRRQKRRERGGFKKRLFLE
jgi:predicted house-cleaning noncanonical NTP pyrophosphatase (MazG superfamily)